MAWVTCFPLPQWGRVTLNRKLMRAERNLISPTTTQPQADSLRLRGGAGGQEAEWSLVGALVSPAPMLPPEFGLPTGALEEGARPSPGSPSLVGRYFSSGLRAGAALLSIRTGRSGEPSKHLSLLLGGPLARIGVSTRPRPSVRYPTFSPFHEHPPLRFQSGVPCPPPRRAGARRGGEDPDHPAPTPSKRGKEG